MKKLVALILCLCMLIPTLPVFAADEVLVHYSEATAEGKWAASFTLTNYDGGAQLWTNAKGDSIVYKPEGLKKGNYEAFYYVIPHEGNSENMSFIIKHNGKYDEASIKTNPNSGGPSSAGWVSIGILDFSGSGDESFTHKNAGDGNTRGTGLKLVPTKKKVNVSNPVEVVEEENKPAEGTAKIDNTIYKNEIILHYQDAELFGSWADSVTLTNFDGGAQAWTNKKGDSIVFTAKDIKAGNYEIFYYNVYHTGNAERTDITVAHNEQTTKLVAVTNESVGGPSGSGWMPLGVLDFKGTGTETFTLESLGNGNARGTGIKIVPTDKEVVIYNPVTEESIDPELIERSPEGIPLIGEKKPNSDSQVTNITSAPAGKCTWTNSVDSDGNENAWRFSGAAPSPMVEDYTTLWIANAGEEATVTYNPEIEAYGDVNIFVYLLYWHENQNPNVKYEIHHNGKVDTVMLDPTTLTESSWVYLGTFDFEGNPETEFVKLLVQPNDNKMFNTRASTVMFEIVNTEGGIWQTKYVTPIDGTVVDTLADVELAPLDKFADMVEHWAHYDVEYMANEGLIAGKGEDVFDPEAMISRAEYLTILDRAMGYELITGESYADVSQDAWYATYIATAKANGLINGLPTDDGFKPEQPITREEMALFTYNAIKATGKNDEWVASLPDDFAKFTDTAEISDYAKEAMQYLVQTGIIKGMTETTAAPKGNATRAQGAVILKRFMQQFVWAGPPTGEEWVLMFNDEFNGTEMDWGVWRSEASAPGHIMSSRWPENVEVHDGAVHLVVRKESKGGKQWTAGSVWVRPEVFAQTYGYWEARYKYTAAAGINNSFWTYVPHSHNIHQNPDVTTHYELDITEGHYPNKVNMNYHTWVTGERKQHGGSWESPYDLSKDYHTYALEWTPTELKYYHDGQLLRVQENYNAHQLQFPYLSSAVLNWAGKITNEAHGTAQIVDYVRIWQRKADAENPELNFKGEPFVGASPTDVARPQIVTDVDGNEITIPPVTVAEQKVDKETYEGEIVIEAKVNETGNWRESSAIRNFNGGVHKWTDMKDARSWYELADVAAGEYKVYFWRLPHVFNNNQMDFMVKQDGKYFYLGSAALKIEASEKAEAGWVEVGTLKVTGDKEALIENINLGGNCRATAIKLVAVK